MSRSALIFRGSVFPYPTPSVWRAAVNHITDGDTLWLERDGGCRNTDLVNIRLTGPKHQWFNAPELNTPEGKLARNFIYDLLAIGTVVIIKTKPDPDKYGRWLSPVLIDIDTASILLRHKYNVEIPNHARIPMALGDTTAFVIDLATLMVEYCRGCDWVDRPTTTTQE